MSIINISSYITSAGLKAVTSAGSFGSYFSVKYFVPFYDPSFDASIAFSNSVSSTPISVSAMNSLSAATSVPGEVIFASSAANYTLSKPVFFYQRSGMNSVTNGTNGTLNTRQEVPASVNMLSSKPMTQVVSAATYTPTTTFGSFALTNAQNITGANLASYNPLSAKPYPADSFFRVQSYSPKATGTSACGVYKCRIPAGTGTFKFNGLALYVSKITDLGYDVYGYSPELFAFVLFDKPQMKTDSTGGLNSFEVDVDLGFDFSSYITTGNPVYYETSYWTKVPLSSNTSAYALNYDGDVVISSSATPGSWLPRAKLTITQNDRAAIRIAANDLKYAEFKVDRYGLNNAANVENNLNDLAVLSLDTSCPDDSLIQLGYKTSATAIKSIAMGCNSLAYGYSNHNISAYENSLTQVNGGYTIAMGVDTSAGGFASLSIGASNLAHGFGCFAGGYLSQAINYANNANDGADPDTGFNFAYGYMTSAISDSSMYCSTVSDYLGDNGTTGDKGSNISIGQQTLAKGSHTIALGFASSALGQASIALGRSNISNGCYTYTMGLSNSAKGPGSVAIGVGNVAASWSDYYHSWAFGGRTSATGNQSLSLGFKSLASGDGSISIGSYTSETGSSSATGSQSIAIGQSLASGSRSFAIGFGASATGDECIAIGYKTYASYKGTFAIGFSTSASGNMAFAAGQSTLAQGSQSVAIGFGTSALGTNSFAGGSGSKTTGAGGFAFGYGAVAGSNSFAFGNAAKASGNTNTVFGQQSEATGSDSVILGSQSKSSGYYDYSIGYSNTINGTNSMVFGRGITLNDTDTIVIGGGSNRFRNINILGSQNITIGDSSTNMITLDSTYITITGQMSQTPKIGLYITNTNTSFDFSLTRFINDVWTRTIRIVPAIGVPFVNDTANASLGTVINSNNYSSNSRCAFFYNPITETIKVIPYKAHMEDYTYTDLDANDTDVWYLLYETLVPGEGSVRHHNVYPNTITKSMNLNFGLDGQGDGDGSVNIKTSSVKITKSNGTKYTHIDSVIDCYGQISKYGGSGDSGVRMMVDGVTAIYESGASVLGATGKRFGVSSGSGIIDSGPIFWSRY